MTDLTDKFAVVSGAGRDIGQAIAIELARRGADVAFTWHAASGEETESAIRALGRRAFSRQVDLLDGAAVEEFAAWARAQAGRTADILVNVAGGLVARKKMEEMDEAFWDHVIALNLKTAFLLTKAILPHMADGGAIVNLSSQAGRDGGGPGGIAYGAAKSALMAFTRGLAKELGPRRIRVNGVCPGMIDTTFHDRFTKPEVRQRVASMTPLGREGEAEEVAKLVAFLASAEASFVNGDNIDINGGILFS
ncbi:MAG TPA: SDR family oxidoreductase [Verrucomicrobiae bacterium]|nr:SDR family oxidoreductase [Verrucomicrobiae bacterium]